MINIPKKINTLFQLFSSYGHELFLVGGSCRDLIMGKEPHDYDFATNITPTQMKEMLEDYNAKQQDKTCKIGILPTGEKYGTMTFRFKGESFEITTYRKDGNYSDGRRPDAVQYSETIIDDLSRRDLTCNAIAYNPVLGLVDPFNGVKDIHAKILRTVGSPTERFNEDALRIMRTIRFAYKLNFSVEKETANAIKRDIKKLKNISTERIQSELVQILGYLRYDYNFDLFTTLINYLFHSSEKTERIKAVCDINTIVGKMVFLSWYLCENKDYEKIIRELKFDNQFVKDYMAVQNMGNGPFPNHSKTEMKECLYKYGPTNVAITLTVWEAYGVGFNYILKMRKFLENILFNNEPYSLSHLAINGEDIKSLGYTGKEIGKQLFKALKYVWANPHYNIKNHLISYLGETKW